MNVVESNRKGVGNQSKEKGAEQNGLMLPSDVST